MAPQPRKMPENYPPKVAEPNEAVLARRTDRGQPLEGSLPLGPVPCDFATHDGCL
jgi:hypothetical protein